MIESTRIYRLLGHYRNLAPVHIDQLVEVLLCVSAMLIELPEIEELDINPLVANAKEVMALDARVVIAAPAA